MAGLSPPLIIDTSLFAMVLRLVLGAFQHGAEIAQVDP
jgi:hypothetical protein